MIVRVWRSFMSLRLPILSNFSFVLKPETMRHRDPLIRLLHRKQYQNLLDQFKDPKKFQSLLKSQTPLQKANDFLYRLRFSKDKQLMWQCTKQFSEYIRKVIEANPTGKTEEFQELLHNMVKVLTLGNILCWRFKRECEIIFQKAWDDRASEGQKLLMIQDMSYANPPHAKSLFKTHITLQFIKCLPKDHLIDIPLLMSKTNHWPSNLFQYCLNLIHPILEQLDLHRTSRLVSSLSEANRYINRDFVKKLADYIVRFSVDFRHSEHAIQVFDAVSRIERNQRNVNQYTHELDEVYACLVNEIKRHGIGSVGTLNAYKLITALRRVGYYDEQMVEMLLRVCLDREVKRHEPGVKHDKRTTFMAGNICAMMNLLAFYDYDITRPLASEFVKSVFGMLDQGKLETTPLLLGNLIWALCIFFPAQKISKYVQPILQQILLSKPKPNDFNMYILKMCQIYFLKHPQITKSITSCNLPPFLSDSTPSLTQKHMKQIIISLGIPCIEQHTVANLIHCDICIPQLGRYFKTPIEVNNIIVEMHGFGHYMRNVPRLKGKSVLRRKLLEMYGYRYFYIPLEEWEMAQGEQVAYMREFLGRVCRKVVSESEIGGGSG